MDRRDPEDGGGTGNTAVFYELVEWRRATFSTQLEHFLGIRQGLSVFLSAEALNGLFPGKDDRQLSHPVYLRTYISTGQRRFK